MSDANFTLSTEEKELGKIISAKFGHGGYQGAQFGIQFDLRFGGSSGVMDFWGFWSQSVECSSHCKWTEAERDKAYAATARRIDKLLIEAKVSDVTRLVGIPVEVTMDRMTLKSWRVLTEVL